MEYFNKYFLDVVKNKYAQFDGRASRSEFWYYILFRLIISVIAAVLGNIIGFPIFELLVFLALFVPDIAIAVRRLHDINKTGWWLLVGLIPLIGALVLIAFFVMKSYPDDNQYGPPPLPTEV
ncbi:MAG TPA: DUF805 domain-containing protein [Campylobacterales bacterium]|nr:DUF805 domain-containing protein [Campylobacterales bacterium]